MSKTRAATASASLPLQERFVALEEQLNEELVERESEIRASINALIAGHHVFFLGTPGVAKSYLFTRLLAYITDAQKFNIMLTRYTVPEEVNGPQSVQAMKNDKYIRKIEGYLPTADLAFIDEIFKANSSILNSLLQAVNERLYRHGTDMIRIPLSSMFCASNELPQDENLEALYDRLLVRLQVKEVTDTESIIKMITTEVDPEPQPLLSWSQVQQAKAEAQEVILPKEVILGLAEIKRRLHEQNIEVTGRRLRQAKDIIRAAAWLDGEHTADLEHLRPLQHVFWSRPDQINTVLTVVSNVASPLDGEALTLLDEITNLRRTCERLDEEVSAGRLSEHEHKRAAMTEFHTSQRFMEAYENLEKRAKNRRRMSEPMLRCHNQLSWLTKYFMKIFNLDEASGIQGLERFDG